MTEHQDENPTATDAAADEQAWTPPDRLTPPPVVSSSPPALALGLALAVSLGAGVALWVSSQFFYIYIFYNFLIGGALGWALSFAPKKAGFTNVTALLVPGVVLAALPYVLVKVLFVLQFLPDVQAQAPEATFVDLFLFLLANDTLFGAEIGTIGSVVVLLVETGITIYALHGRLLQGITEARIASVPGDVIDFVLNGFANEWDTARVREELARRGWTRAEDQDRAIGSGFDVISALQAQANQGA